MAEGKKTFIFYSDWINMIREMPDVDAGALLKHVLSYVNDEDPQTDNLLVKMAFGHMKPILKRDLEKWETQLHNFSQMGKKSAEKRALNQEQPKSTYVEPTSTVNVNVNDNVNDNVNVNVNKNDNSSFKKEPKEINFDPFDENFRIDWLKWVNYKKDEFKQSYKKIETEQIAFDNLLKLSNKNINTAREIINQSIANQWKGLFTLKTDNNGTGTNTNQGINNRSSKDVSTDFSKPNGGF